jgi:hypothetical protein
MLSCRRGGQSACSRSFGIHSGSTLVRRPGNPLVVSSGARLRVGFHGAWGCCAESCCAHFGFVFGGRGP